MYTKSRSQYDLHFGLLVFDMFVDVEVCDAQIVSRAIFRLTGKKTNPHLLRDSVVTHIRGQDVSEKKLEALALFMGHSLATQKSSYDRRTLEEKIAPATELIQSIKPRSLDAQHQVENES